jgi:hypothetical protein
LNCIWLKQVLGVPEPKGSNLAQLTLVAMTLANAMILVDQTAAPLAQPSI